MDICLKDVLANVSQCTFLLQCQKLLTRLYRIDLRGHVVKVDSDSGSVLKLDAFDADLVEFLDLGLLL